jgi:hypothetical protein
MGSFSMITALPSIPQVGPFSIIKWARFPLTKTTVTPFVSGATCSLLIVLSSLYFQGLSVCVTGAGAGVDSAWEQEKLEARKMLENATESPASSARFVRRLFAEV